jgi:hypothetical protein
MARSRKTTDNTGGKKMAGLTPEQIKALLGKTRQKGVYDRYLVDFLKMGEAGISVNETWVDLADKKATTIKQGFENAKDKQSLAAALEEAGLDPSAATNVKVIASDEQVFLVNLAAVETEVPA